MTMTEPPSYSAAIASSSAAAAPHANASAMEQGRMAAPAPDADADTTSLRDLHSDPATIICPFCHQRAETRVDKRHTGAA